MISTALIGLYLIIPFLTWKWCRKRKAPLAIGFVSALVFGYIAYVGSSFIYGKELEYEVYRYDLDGNRSFSENEMTDDAKLAMKKWTSDTGRSLVSIVAAPVTFIWVGFVYLALLAVNRTRIYLNERKTKTA